MSENIAVRLNKYLAQCGIGSRRDCDKFISDGLIKIDGRVASMGEKVTGEEEILFRGRVVESAKPNEYYLYHKPRGFICTARDEQGRKTIYDDLKSKGLDAPYLRYVGRLDMESEGALILTNDGDMIHAITHPKFHIKKVYQVLVKSKISSVNLNKIVEEGVESEGDILSVGAVRAKDKGREGYWYEVDLYEGKNRQVRRVFGAIGHRVDRLIRTQFSSVKLRELKYGEFRELDEREVKGLKGRGFEVDKKRSKKAKGRVGKRQHGNGSRNH
jgi:23S rRNA pseudouridine2605 synthase